MLLRGSSCILRDFKMLLRCLWDAFKMLLRCFFNSFSNALLQFSHTERFQLASIHTKSVESSSIFVSQKPATNSVCKERSFDSTNFKVWPFQSLRDQHLIQMTPKISSLDCWPLWLRNLLVVLFTRRWTVQYTSGHLMLFTNELNSAN